MFFETKRKVKRAGKADPFGDLAQTQRGMFHQFPRAAKPLIFKELERSDSNLLPEEFSQT